MGSDTVRQNSVKAWLLASRPKTLTGAAVPVMLATALAFSNYHVKWEAAILCFLFAFMMQIDANFINDYFDCVRGNDDETRLGPKRACAMGWISLRAMRNGIALMTVLACIVGLPLAYWGGWEMVLIGIACVIFSFLYTTYLSYLGLGDLLVLIFFGIVPVCCTYYIETEGMMQWQTVAVSVACGLVIDTLLIINNYRDIDNDRRAGKHTLAVILGKKAMEILYLCLVPVAVAIIACAMETPWTTLAAGCVIMVFHVTTWMRMRKISAGPALNGILGKTARNIFLFGILVCIAIILC